MLYDTLRTDWESDPVNQIRLAQLLSDPVLVKALNIVRAAFRPRVSDVTVSDSAASAHCFHYTAGASGAVDALVRLSIPQHETRKTLPHAGWGNLSGQKPSDNTQG